MYLMATREGRGLFSKAILQSAYMINAPELRAATHGGFSSEAVGVWLSEKLGAGDLAALRSMDAIAMAEAAAPTGYFPFFTIDGRILPRQVVEVFDRGEQAKVPLLVGYNAGEIRSLRVLAPPVPADAATYETQIRERYADLAEAFLKLYPSSDLEESLLAAARDGLYGWTAQRLAAKQTAAGAPVYLYYFDHGYPAAEEMKLHAFHAAELPYMFGTARRTPPRWPRPPDTAGENQLSDAMIDYWASFARGGVPQSNGQPEWPAYGAERHYMKFDGAPQPGKHLMPGMYELNEEVVCRRRAKGGIPWNWNYGIAAPPLPAAEAACN
jgi:para-nitrobenzyl esterase